MGLFDRFRGRRESEDALAQARAEAGIDAGVGADAAAPQPTPPPGDPNLGVPLTSYGTPTDGTQLPGGQDVQIPGIGGLAELQAMIQQAAAQGNLHIDTKQMQMGMGMPGAMVGLPMLDLRSDPSRRAVVFDILRKHGMDPHEGQAIQVTDPQIQAEIMQALQQHAAQQPPQPPAGGELPPPAPPPSS